MQHILVVEDAIEYQKIVERTLGHYAVVCVVNAEDALQHLRKNLVDLILLDINLPTRNGYSPLSELQSSEQTQNIPIICMTGKNEMVDKVTAFSLGAEDYIVKPFDPIELRARVDSKLMRKLRSKDKDSIFKVGILSIDEGTHRVFVGEEGERREVKLTQTEFKILMTLIRRQGQIYTRDQILVAVWGTDASVLDRVIDTHISAIRKKLKLGNTVIEAVPGVGYRFQLDGTSKKAS